MPTVTAIDQLLSGRKFHVAPLLDNAGVLYSYASSRLTYWIIYKAQDGEMYIGADFDGNPFGPTSLFEVGFAVEELAFTEKGGYGRPAVLGHSRLPDGSPIRVLEMMVKDDGELILWPQGFVKIPPNEPEQLHP